VRCVTKVSGSFLIKGFKAILGIMESKVQCDNVKNAIGRNVSVQQTMNVTGPWQHENFNVVYVQPSNTSPEKNNENTNVSTNANKYDEISLNPGQSVVFTPHGTEDYRPSVATGDPEALTEIKDIYPIPDNKPCHRNAEHSALWPFLRNIFSFWFLRISGSSS
jgi:hypothetical protein